MVVCVNVWVLYAFEWVTNRDRCVRCIFVASCALTNLYVNADFLVFEFFFFFYLYIMLYQFEALTVDISNGKFPNKTNTWTKYIFILMSHMQIDYRIYAMRNWKFFNIFFHFNYRKLFLDLVPRVGPLAVDPHNISVVSLHQVHVKSAENAKASSVCHHSRHWINND